MIHGDRKVIAFILFLPRSLYRNLSKMEILKIQLHRSSYEMTNSEGIFISIIDLNAGLFCI